MARGVNKWIGIGNLGADPEMRYTPNGNAVTSFSIACTRAWTNAEGEAKEATDWIRIEVWNKLAEVANQYLTKGSKVYIEGRLQIDRVEKDGATQYYTKIVCNTLVMLGGGSFNDAPEEEAEEDIPF